MGRRGYAPEFRRRVLSGGDARHRCRPPRRDAAHRGPNRPRCCVSPTHRQLEVLLARCQTASRKGAAALLGIQTKTVHWHLARLFDRCGCVDEAMAGFMHRDEFERLRAA
jgi:DNA-binding NarL/FixJ family response regulator